ncbi:ribosomal RNA small subunit methyltransferase A [Candidatus Dojkabacteria bacterium]|nr:ribosomal RNA small subunit methyltransferase A [Candidatus Dojkabacteria bacterium]
MNLKNKDLGQNFLVNRDIISRIVSQIKPEEDETFIEIGPGLGAITVPLASKVKKIIAVEIDSRLHLLLNSDIEKFKIKNIKLINEDILKVNLEKILEKENIQKYRVYGSLPYSISKQIIKQFLTYDKKKPKDLTFIIQKEVAMNYIQAPPKATFLYHMSEIYSHKQILMNIAPKNFRPIPKVESSLIKFELKTKTDIDNPEQYIKFVKILFTHPRKTILNNLRTLNKNLLNKSKFEHDNEITMILSKRAAECSKEELFQLFPIFLQLTDRA